MTYIPPKSCAVCRAPFTPIKRARGRWSETCGSYSCRSTLSVRRSDWGVRIAAANAAKTAKAKARIAAIVASMFGELSEREQALFRIAEDHGYTRGANAAYAKGRKAQTVAA